MKKNLTYLFVAYLMFAFAACSGGDDDSIVDPNKPGGGGGGGGGSSSPNAEVIAKNVALMEKVTASWCGPCGQWGWDLHKEIMTSVGSNGFVMAVHGSSSSKLTNPLAVLLTESYPRGGFPTFRANFKDETKRPATNSVDPAGTKSNMENAAMTQEAMGAHLCANAKIEKTADKVTVKATAKFFKDMDATKDYYISAWVSEDNVSEEQNGRIGKALHSNVFRGAASSNLWGVKIDADAKKDKWFNHTFEINWNAAWNQDNSTIVLVLMSKDSGSDKYEFVNANLVPLK